MADTTDNTRNHVHGDVPGMVVQAGSIENLTVLGTSSAPPLRPNALPPDVSLFTGRTEELENLDSSLGGGPETAVVISSIAGSGGMGKTSLAVHWAHRVRDRFPDGQLHVNLHSYDTSPPSTPDQALDGFLRALGVSGSAIPQDLDGKTGLYRSLLAGRRVLVLVDNASHVDQIRPLLPNTPTCLVLVTSRNLLSGLVARDGARRIELRQLPLDEAVSLLRRIIGPARADAEPDATTELARRCAGLPLALRIAAERVAARPRHRIADIVAEVAGRHRLDALAVKDDEATTIRTVFGWSYHSLPADAARLFRLLGLHPGPTISTHTAAALSGTTLGGVRPLLDTLTNGHLLTEVEPNRFQFHDLLRDYAADRAGELDSQADRTAALRRLLTWYLHTAYPADCLLYPDGWHMPLDFPAPSLAPLRFDTRAEALRWCDAEIANILAAARLAADHGHHDLAARLPRAVSVYLALRARRSDAVTAGEIALVGANWLGDPNLELDALTGLGDALFQAGRLDECTVVNLQQLVLARRLGNVRHEAGALHELGIVYKAKGKLDVAVEHFQAALPLFRAIGNHRGEALMLGFLGDVCRERAQFDEALDYLHQSLTIMRDNDNRWNEAVCLRWLGQVHADLGQHAEAVDWFTRSAEIYEALDDRYETARTLHALGDTHREAGNLGLARTAWREALALYDELHMPQAAELRARFSAREGGGGPG
ncbi:MULTISPECIES: ATP-binding protein [unclassified Saccharothrix]|uniref:ATP-binding protein n=1 Tax=unclassified Saccharothrix TaxID=2593673 RepID=UPI00307CD5B8